MQDSDLPTADNRGANMTRRTIDRVRAFMASYAAPAAAEAQRAA